MVDAVLGCGKLFSYSSPGQQKQFTYTARGHLQTTGTEKYDFDFGEPGTGIRTAAPDWVIPQNGLDPFGKILTEISGKSSLETTYDPMGQVIFQGGRRFEWDPWGRLVKIKDKAFTWEASYDPFGRRLQTRYTPAWDSTLVTTSLYDPEVEFQEIGVKFGDKTFWKIYGPNSCDAIIDESGNALVLIHNALGQLTAVVSELGTVYSEEFPSPYGPQSKASLPSDLLSYAQSLTWHSRNQDPTGLIWLGKRYYDPKGGRFLSPDPVGYPNCLDLYAYAGGDPINYWDLDGRFASPMYQTIGTAVINLFRPLGTHLFNNFSTYRANHNLTSSSPFKIPGFDLSNGAIGYINGIDNMLGDSKKFAGKLSLSAGGAKIHGIYNATSLDCIRSKFDNPLSHFRSAVLDVLECALGHLGFHTAPVELLKKQWANFRLTHGPDAKFLQFCHSGGAIHVKNALLTSPESIRQSIIVVALAPGAIVPKELCFNSYNYVSRRDFVTHCDLFGKWQHRNELIMLEPHPGAELWDHGALSPTFDDTIRGHIVDFINEYGGKK